MVGEVTNLCNGRVIPENDAVLIHDLFGSKIHTIWTNGRPVVETTPNCSRVIVIDLASTQNHAPVLNTSGSPKLATIVEDSTQNSGTLISQLIASAGINLISDPDDNQFNTNPVLEGIAVIGVDQRAGRWEYSVDPHRLRWRPLSSPSPTRARLLAADENTRVRFVPAPDFNGTINAALTFKGWDQTSGSNGGTGSAGRPGGRTAYSTASETARITVTAVNDPPSFTKGANLTVSQRAGPQTYPNWAAAITPGPADEAGQNVSFSVINNNNGLFNSQPTLSTNGTLTFSPNPAASGSATVSVILNDSGGTAHGGTNQSPPQTFTIATTVNTGQPVAADDEATTPADTAVVIPVLTNDNDPGSDPLTVINVGTPTHGGTATDGTTVTYTPTGGFNGIDSFTYTVSDGSLSDSAKVTVFVGTVNRSPVLDPSGSPALVAIVEDDINNAGTAVSTLIASVAPLDMITDVDVGGLEGIAVIDADERYGDWQFTVDGGTSWQPLGNPQPAAARLLASSGSTRVRFVPDANFNGPVEAGLTFRAWDRTNGSNGQTFDANVNGGLTAFSSHVETASIMVNPVADPPNAADDTANTPQDTPRTVAVVGNDIDVDGDPLTVSGVTNPGSGAAAIGLDNTVIYTPTGAFTGIDTFSYTLSDATPLTDTAVVTITVGLANNPPFAVDDVGQASAGMAVILPVLNNDSDPDEDTLIVIAVGPASNGAVTTDGWAVTYTPISDFTGDDTFTYTVSDGDLTAAATVTVAVAGPSGRFWEDDTFDNLDPGPLHTQNGWFKARVDRASPIIVDEGGNQVVQIDPSGGATIVMEKDVSDQPRGRHTLTFRVKVSGTTNPDEPSLAKLTVYTTPNPGWDRLFQLYFGPSMRVNYGPAGEAAEFISAAVPDHWYDIRVEFDNGNGQLDLWVDGSRVLDDVPLRTGPITGLGLSGWDRPGAVLLDNVRAFRTWDPGPAGPCGTSSFDSDDEGWLGIDDDAGELVVPDFTPDGGDPGGYLTLTNESGAGILYWQAPVKFLGDQVSAYNGTLSFALRTASADSQFTADDVILFGNNLVMGIKLDELPDADWSHHTVSLNESAGWLLWNESRPPTMAEMKGILANLEKIWIRANYDTFSIPSSLDHVVLNPANCPKTTSDTYWTNPAGGQWTDPANWSTGSVPGPADHAFITLNGAYSVTLKTEAQAGSLTIGSGPTLWLKGDTGSDAVLTVSHTVTNQGQLLFFNDEPLNATGDSRLIVSAGRLVNSGYIEVLPGTGGSHEIIGAVDNSGIVNVIDTLNFTGLWSNSGTVFIAKDQKLVVDGSTNAFHHNGGILDGDGSLTVRNGGGFTYDSGSVYGAAPALVGAAVSFGAQPAGIGAISVSGGSTISGHIGSGQTLILGSRDGAAASAVINQNLTNNGTIHLDPGSSVANATLTVSSGTLTNFGLLEVNLGSGDRQMIGAFSNQGITSLNGSPSQILDLSQANFTNGPGGIMQGEGTVIPGLVFLQNGLFSPGFSPGELTLSGNYTPGATSRLNLEIAGPADFDHLAVSGLAVLDGTFDITLLEGYEPALGAKFKVISCGSCTGQFAAVNGQAIGNDKRFEVIYESGAVKLKVVHASVIYLPLVVREGR